MKTKVNGCLLLLILAVHADQATGEQLLDQAEIDKQPLGSPLHPVRAVGRQGELDYIQGLDCENGTIPSYRFEGEAGVSPYGNTLTKYLLVCEGEGGDPQKVYEVYMDRHHEVADTKAVEGFVSWL